MDIFHLPQTQPMPLVLVVEDEPLVRMVACDILEDAGFRAVSAGDGEAALAMLDRCPDVDVLFTDINMPGAFDGLELARRVHGRRPDIGLILTSGRMRPGRDEIPDDGQFLAKPYDARSVPRLVARMTGRTLN